MRFAFTEEQQALRDMVRRFLADHSSSEQVRAAMQTEAGFDAALWDRMAQELGLAAMIIPEGHGGLGLGAVELTAVMEEMGRALVCAPFFSTVCLATHAILEAATPAQQGEWLPAIAEGRRRVALAVSEESGRLDAASLTAEARPEAGGFRLHGTKSFVVDGATADDLLVVARAPGSSGATGIGLYRVAGDAPGVTRSRLTTLDQTRRLAQIELNGVRVETADALGTSASAWPALERTLARAAIALAAEQVGAAERCMDLSVEYAKVRVQFGRAIGSFQAVKHKCADMLLEVECARSACYYAAWVAAQHDDLGGDDGLAIVAATARATASDAFMRVAGETIQVHGGIGFTWEHDAHLLFKRAKASQFLLETPSDARERIAAYLEL